MAVSTAPPTPGVLFCFGLGYTAMSLSRRLDTEGWQIRGTCRGRDRRRALAALGIKAAIFNGSVPMDPPDLLNGATHVLLSIPPDEECDSTFKTRSILRIHMSLNGDTHEQNNVQGFVKNVILHLNQKLNGNAHKVETWKFRNNCLC